MQKIKGMVRTRSGSVEAAGPYGSVRPGRLAAGQRSASMTSGYGGTRPAISPGWDGPGVVEEEEMVDDDDGGGNGEYADEDVDDEERRGYSNDDVFGNAEPWSARGGRNGAIRMGRR